VGLFLVWSVAHLYTLHLQLRFVIFNEYDSEHRAFSV
jgi:hypothetical protein